MPEAPRHSIVSILPCTNIEASTAFYARLGLVLHGDFGTYRILTDGAGWVLHLSSEFPEGWLTPGKNPNGLYVYRQDVDGLAAHVDDLLDGARPEHKPWGMYEFALSDPDGTLVRIGWPSRLMKSASVMRPRDVVTSWIDAFNRADVEALAALYHPDAVNHQVVQDPIEGREAIRAMFAAEFAKAEMVCIPENRFEDGEWAILEWRDPKGLRGCGFFHVTDGRIAFQRGYWDKLSLLRLHGIAT